uniref:Endonuclease/exonuclease/phosphatase domain-containing protein n=1 Tax=Tetranychus urticae TaxID=32264 RepID=T1KID6_TETUR
MIMRTVVLKERVCGQMHLSVNGQSYKTKAATKNLMKISADEKPDFTAFNELTPEDLDYTVPKVSIVTAKQPNAAAIACFDSESFQFISKCCLELSTVTCVKARWNNIKLAIIYVYFSSNVAKYSVEDLTKDLKFIAALIKTKMGSDVLKLFVGDFNAYHPVMTFCNLTEMYVLNPFQPNYVVGAKETVCDLILGCRAFKEGVVSCKMELNNKTTRLDMSRYIDMDGFWLFNVPEKTDRASEGSNPERQNSGHRHDGQRDVPGVPGVASGLRMPYSANWPK